MIQYLELLKTIKEKGTYKPPAREGMPGSLSLFGYQFRHNLQEGFPLLTTKKMFWKGVVIELLWFLRGDTNIKYLVDNGVHIWDQDAYQHYLRKIGNQEPVSFVDFVDLIQVSENIKETGVYGVSDYNFGDCGYQYGRVWRNWESYHQGEYIFEEQTRAYYTRRIDQIVNVIKSLKETPESRRHIVTAIDPAHDTDLALYWCHALFQFNCRPMTLEERANYQDLSLMMGDDELEERMKEYNTPKYYLDCQLYQRSADVFLGVPFNIASYALLTHIIAKICNMVPGEFIHTFGDVHIYDNHIDAVNEQLTREPKELSGLKIVIPVGEFQTEIPQFTLENLEQFEYWVEGYEHHPAIKAKLSTGLK